MPPSPSSSTSRYRPPRIVPISAKRAPLQPLHMVRRAADVRDALRPAWYPMPLRAPEGVPLEGGLELQVSQVAPELWAQIGSPERELDGRLEPAHRRAGVIARSFELIRVHALLLHHRLDVVGELDLPAGPALGLLELVEDLRREHVPADDGEVRRRLLRLGLLDELRDPVQTTMVERVLRTLRGDDAVAARLLPRDLHDRDDRAMSPLICMDELADAGAVADHHVIGQDHREWLVADEVLGHQDGVAETQLLLLPHVGDLGEIADMADLPEHLDVALLLEQVLELVGEVEVILDRPLLAGGDDDHLLDARGDGLFDGVLDDRFVDQRQHLLGLRLGRWQEPRTPAGGREDGFSDAHETSAEGVGWVEPVEHRPL